MSQKQTHRPSYPKVEQKRSFKVDRALAYKARGDGDVEVYDLDFASYCLMRGLDIVDMIETRPRQYLFLFFDKESKIGSLSVDYTNSESARHADCVRRIKKAIRSTVSRRG